MVYFFSDDKSITSNTYLSYKREDDGYSVFNIACGYDCETEILFENESVTVKVNAISGSMEFFDADKNLLASTTVAPSDEGYGRYRDISCKVEDGKIMLRFPIYNWYDNYPNYDRESERWDSTIVGYKDPVCFSVDAKNLCN